MRSRNFLYFLLGLLLASVLVAAATNVAMHNTKHPETWMAAQQHTPLLWMVDGCAVIILLGSYLFGAAFSGNARALAEDNSRQITTLANTIEQLIRQNQDYAERLETLEEAGDVWHEGFEEEARRLTEQAFLALSDNIESNARQLDAVNLALRYQRAEFKAVRAAFKTGELALPDGPPPPLEMADRPPRAILPREPKVETPSGPVIQAKTEAEPRPDAITASEPKTEPAEEAEETEQKQVEEAQAAVTPGAVAEALSKLEPSTVQEQTVNAGSTVVETLEFDVNGDETAEGSSDTNVDISSSKPTSPAEEFRSGQQQARSIFRHKRP